MFFLFFPHLKFIFSIGFSLSSNFLLSTSSNPVLPSNTPNWTFNSHFWCHFFSVYGSMPASLFFLEFELPNFEILICITYSSPTALPHGHSTPLKPSGQNRRGQTSMLSSETILSFLTQVTRKQIRGLFIYILLHHVQTKTLEKREWLTSSSLDWWKVLLSGGSSQSTRASELSIKWKWTNQCPCGQNETSHAWQEPPSWGAFPPAHPSLDTPTLWRMPPHQWIKMWFRIEKKKGNSTLVYSSAQHRSISKIQMRVTGLWCAHQPPPPHCTCDSCSPREALFNSGMFWHNFIKFE